MDFAKRLIRPSTVVWAILIGTLIFIGCSEGDSTAPGAGDSGMITTGESTQLLQGSLPGSGGTVTVTQSDALLNGLQLTVPSGAYTSGIQITIREATITEHGFGENFDPITPLIGIENGGEFAGIPMTLHIPLPDLQGRFPVAFYYDRAAGTLEPLTPVGRGEDWLDVAVRHFSEIVVSATQIELLRQGGGFHTLFDPVENGWSFVNFGTWPVHEGMCGGMSIGASRFYQNFKASPAITGFFDNDTYWFRTPKVWEDDVTGLRYCTELQKEFISSSSIWTLDGKSPLDPIWKRSEEDHFWSLCYALLIINQPQFLYLSVRNDATAPAHAILAYAYEIDGNRGRLLVYDPNYPGKEGEIIFDFGAGKFQPYTSAANAGALADGHTFSYDEIIFIPLSTICDANKLDRIWQKVSNNTIGDALFPTYELYAVPVDNENLPRVKLLDAATGKTTFLPYGKFTVEIEPADKNLTYSLVSWVNLPDINEIEKGDPAGEINLEKPNGENLVGIQVNVKPSSSTAPSWAGFQWFKIRAQSLWIEPVDTSVSVQQELRLTARSNGTAPSNARFEWDFGDGESETVHGDSTVAHVYEKVGSFIVTVRMYDGQGSEALGNSQAQVQVTEFVSIAVLLTGMESLPPSTIKGTDGVDIPQITFTNKIGNPPPLTWSDKEFVVDYTYSMSGVDFATRISGRLSDDGKSIKILTAITSGIGVGGAYSYTSSIAITDFPLENVIPGVTVGGELRGKSAQTAVSNIAWRQESRDTQGNTIVSELVSIDWNSDKTKLAVYFYR
jgi:hypothetical protein